MKKITEFFNRMRQFSKTFGGIYRTFCHYRDFPYHIEEIDTQNQIVIIRCRGKKTVIKSNFESVISDERVIDGLCPIQACSLGGYFGRSVRAIPQTYEEFKKIEPISFRMRNKNGRYKIIFLERTGKIGYYDQKSRQEFIEHPFTIANDDQIISDFDPSEACYIGMLAGISMERAIFNDSKFNKNSFNELSKARATLRIVK